MRTSTGTIITWKNYNSDTVLLNFYFFRPFHGKATTIFRHVTSQLCQIMCLKVVALPLKGPT